MARETDPGVESVSAGLAWVLQNGVERPRGDSLPELRHVRATTVTRNDQRASGPRMVEPPPAEALASPTGTGVAGRVAEKVSKGPGVAPARKGGPGGEPYAGKPHVRIDEGAREEWQHSSLSTLLVKKDPTFIGFFNHKGHKDNPQGTQGI